LGLGRVREIVYCWSLPQLFPGAQLGMAPLREVEQDYGAFSHCESGRILADIGKLPLPMSAVIEFHDQPPVEGDAVEMTAIVYLADLLCRLPGLGYGYYERWKFDRGLQPHGACSRKAGCALPRGAGPGGLYSRGKRPLTGTFAAWRMAEVARSTERLHQLSKMKRMEKL
jgi:hypothetical protein